MIKNSHRNNWPCYEVYMCVCVCVCVCVCLGPGLILWYKMDLQKVGLEGMDWIDLARDRERWRFL